MKRLSGFSLMEMMVVLLITAVVAAVTAPMISKKMVSSAGGDSPWMWAGLKNSIVYNVEGNSAKTANIGGIIPEKDPLNPNSTLLGSRLYIEIGSKHIPHITFKSQLASNANTEGLLHFIFNNDAIFLTNQIPDKEDIKKKLGLSTIIGVNTTSTGTGATVIGASNDTSTPVTAAELGTAIGALARSTGKQGTAIGANSTAAENGTAIGAISTAGANSLALGASANAAGADALAIGFGAKAVKNGCVSIVSGGDGYGATGDYSTAFGYKALASGSNSICIGESTASGYQSISIGTGIKNPGIQSIVIGLDNGSENHSGGGSVSLGGYTNANEYGISIGWQGGRDMHGHSAVAIGAYTRAANNAVALGRGAAAIHSNSTAIGYGARTTAENQIVLGDANTVVYIPGKLVVDRTTYLGLKQNAGTWGAGSLWAKGSSGSCSGWLQTTSDAGTSFNLLMRKGDHDLPSGYTVSDTYTAGGNYNSSSDRRLKNVGEAFKGGLAEIRKLEIFNYTFKKDPNKTPMVGVIAQDLQKVFPNAVVKGDDGFLRIRWDEILCAMVNAIKELDIRVTNNDKKIEALEKQNAELQKKLDKLEQRLDKLEGANKRGK